MGNYFTYIITNPDKSTLYVGMTNDLERRMNEHFENRGDPKTFAGRYFCYNPVYWERHEIPTQQLNEKRKSRNGGERRRKN